MLSGWQLAAMTAGCGCWPYTVGTKTYPSRLHTPNRRQYVAQGARFAKWRAALKVAEGSCPSELATRINAEQLAEYAAICQVRRVWL